MNIFVLDNYDSFTYILAQYLGELGVTPIVSLNDMVTVDQIVRRKPDGILISPGPGRPIDAGISVELVHRLSGSIPILGVCLGHQAIVEAFGGRTISAQSLMHGKTCPVSHSGTDLFHGIDTPTVCMRYHSLISDPERISDELEVVARTDDHESEIMAVSHRRHPTWGLQFHPESIGTERGTAIMKNFVDLVGSV